MEDVAAVAEIVSATIADATAARPDQSSVPRAAVRSMNLRPHSKMVLARNAMPSHRLQALSNRATFDEEGAS